MPSTFFGISIGASALEAAQVGQDVTGHNIANANTPGYSAQTVNLTQAIPFTPSDGSTLPQPGMLGSGVSASSITRATDQFTTNRLRDGYSQQSNQTAQQTALNEVQSSFGEPSTTGLDQALSTFFQSFNDVVNNPQDTGVRASVIQKGVAVTQIFHNIGQQLGDINNGLNTQISTDMTALNSYGSQIANLNGQIRLSLAQGEHPNDLMDQRDVLIDKVSKLANVTVVTQPNGMVNVAVGTSDLVNGLNASTLTLGGLQARGDLQSGELGGLVTAQAATAGFQTNLDTLAANVASAVNTVQSNGADLYGNTGNAGPTAATPFFTGTTAASITVTPALVSDPKLLAAAAAPAGGGPPPPGDGSNASAFAAIQSQSIAGPPFNGQTLQQFYEMNVSTAGAMAASATTAATSAGVNVSQLTQQKESVTGVATDNEMLNMMKYQRAYEAAAKFVSTADGMLDTLIKTL